MITTTTRKIATVLAALVVLAAAGGIAQAATSRPSGRPHLVAAPTGNHRPRLS